MTLTASIEYVTHFDSSGAMGFFVIVGCIFLAPLRTILPLKWISPYSKYISLVMFLSSVWILASSESKRMIEGIAFSAAKPSSATHWNLIFVISLVMTIPSDTADLYSSHISSFLPASSLTSSFSFIWYSSSRSMRWIMTFAKTGSNCVPRPLTNSSLTTCCGIVSR